MTSLLKQWRDSKGMTQNQAANYLEVPKTTYASYEQGKRQPSVDKAKELANKMHVKWTLFFENEVHNTSTNKEVAK